MVPIIRGTTRNRTGVDVTNATVSPRHPYCTGVDGTEEGTALGRLITRRSQVQILPPPPTKLQVRPGAYAPGLLRVVPKMVPILRIRVVSVVPHNPKVACFRHGARHVRVVLYRLLPSRVVLYSRVDRASGADGEGRRNRIGSPTRRSCGAQQATNAAAHGDLFRVCATAKPRTSIVIRHSLTRRGGSVSSG